MNWDSFVIPNKFQGSLFKILTLTSVIFLNHPAFAQTVTDTSGPYTMNLNLTEPEVVFLRINVTDPDYEDEGELYVNGQGPIELWPGGNNDNNDQTMDVRINLNGMQQGWFNQGNNQLEFRFAGDPMVVDGYTVNSVTPILESALPKKVYNGYDIDVDAPISENRQYALEIYKRIVGVTTSIDHPVIIQMEQQLNAGNPKAAAALATEEPGFYNLVIRDFAARMSTRAQSINEPFNDFVAGFIGVTRDDLDARNLLVGDFFYRGNIDVPVRSDIYDDILGSNRHYEEMANEAYDFAGILTRENTQYMRTGNDSYAAHPDPAGVITSRAFMGAHALDGTNRRLVEYTVKQFACFDMEDWADATATDIRVGRDIDRFPGGEGSRYLTTCKACHSVMDGFRGAFAKYDFDNNFVRYNFNSAQSPNSVDAKMNRVVVFGGGFVTRDNSWVNNARSPANEQRFGWRGVVNSGSGVKQFARAIANSRAFSKCMVNRVYREVCRRDVANFEQGMVESLADSFEGSGYSLKGLFQDMVVRPECLGAR